MAPPYLFASVELDEQPALRVITSIIGALIDDIHIGQRVRVEFEASREWFLPVFRPTTNEGSEEVVG